LGLIETYYTSATNSKPIPLYLVENLQNHELVRDNHHIGAFGTSEKADGTWKCFNIMLAPLLLDNFEHLSRWLPSPI